MAGPAITPSQDKEWRYKNLDEASRNSRGIFYLYLGALSYCFLTVVGTTDRQLLLGEKTRLPFLAMEVPLYGFFIAAPLLLMLVYAYLQLYLQHMNGLKDQLRSSGNWEYRRAYPWMINIADDPEHGFIGWAQRFVVAFTLWWSLPIVLEVFYLWVLKRHDKYLSVALYYESALGMVMVFLFWRAYRKRSRNAAASMFAALAAWFFLPHLLFGPIWPHIPKQIVGKSDPRNLNVSFQNLVDERNAKYPELPLVDLRDADLRWANLTSCVLTRADLRGAQLQNANLERANLRGSWLDGAHFDSANLANATMDSGIMTETVFLDAHLAGASLSYSNLKGARFDKAELESAILRHSIFNGASFKRSRLFRTDLSRSVLRKVNLCDAQSFFEVRMIGASADTTCIRGDKYSNAVFDSAILSRARLAGNFRDGSFQHADLVDADMRAADFESVDFSHADMEGALLQGANLRFAAFVDAELKDARLDSAILAGANLDGSDLTNAVLVGAVVCESDNYGLAANVSLDQLSEASTLFGAQLDPHEIKKIPKGSRIWNLLFIPWEEPAPFRIPPPGPLPEELTQ